MWLLDKFIISMSETLNINKTAVKYNVLEILIFVFTVLLLFRLLEHLWRNRDFRKKVSKIQGPLALPIIGNAYLFFRNPVDYMKLMEKLHYRYPKIYRFCLGPSKVLCFLSDPEYIEKILTNPMSMEKDTLYDIVTDVLGPGLLTAPVKIWKPHRRAIAPSFNKSILNSYVKIFEENSVEFAKQLRAVGDKKDYDWSIFTKRYSLDVACKTIMGIDLNMNYTEHIGNDLGYVIEKLNDYGTMRTFNLQYHVGIIYQFSSLKKKFETCKELFINMVTSVVREKLQQLRENNNSVYADTEGNDRKPDLLESIYKNPIFSETNLFDEFKTILGAAMDTTGMAICTLFIMLGMHPDIQQKVYDEVIDAIGLTGGIEPSDLAKMKYTEMVIKENLRLFTPGVLFGRTLTGDIQFGDIVIPKGAMAGVIPSLIHKDPKYWKDPLTFNPYRFSPEEKSKRHPCTYIPFSYGVRNCIGEYYAYQSIKTLTAIVIREFKMCTAYKSVEEVEYTLQGLLTLTHGAKLWFEPRT